MCQVKTDHLCWVQKFQHTTDQPAFDSATSADVGSWRMDIWWNLRLHADLNTYCTCHTIYLLHARIHTQALSSQHVAAQAALFSEDAADGVAEAPPCTCISTRQKKVDMSFDLKHYHRPSLVYWFVAPRIFLEKVSNSCGIWNPARSLQSQSTNLQIALNIVETNTYVH